MSKNNYDYVGKTVGGTKLYLQPEVIEIRFDQHLNLYVDGEIVRGDLRATLEEVAARRML